jgi:DNA-binding MarR family transcriptional regulator
MKVTTAKGSVPPIRDSDQTEPRDAEPPRSRTDGFTHEYLPYLLAQASAMTCAEFTAPLRDAKLSNIGWRILATLHDVEALTIGDLSRIVLTRQPRATQVTKELEREGLVERRQDHSDRRKTYVGITEEGRRYIGELFVEAATREKVASNRLSPQELRQLKLLLRRLIGLEAV